MLSAPVPPFAKWFRKCLLYLEELCESSTARRFGVSQFLEDKLPLKFLFVNQLKKEKKIMVIVLQQLNF